MEEQKQTKGKGIRVGWFFWVYSVLLTLALSIVGTLVVFYAARFFITTIYCGPPSMFCFENLFAFLVAPIGAVLGLVGGIRAVRGMHRERVALLAAGSDQPQVALDMPGQTKVKGASVGWTFWISSTLLVLVLGYACVSLFIGALMFCGTPCFLLGALIGALAGLVTAIALVATTYGMLKGHRPPRQLLFGIGASAGMMLLGIATGALLGTLIAGREANWSEYDGSARLVIVLFAVVGFFASLPLVGRIYREVISRLTTGKSWTRSDWQVALERLGETLGKGASAGWSIWVYSTLLVLVLSYAGLLVFVRVTLFCGILCFLPSALLGALGGLVASTALVATLYRRIKGHRPPRQVLFGIAASAGAMLVGISLKTGLRILIDEWAVTVLFALVGLAASVPLVARAYYEVKSRLAAKQKPDAE